ncbi:MAG: lipopolysaccharide biosynthesis protein [Crocinitomicaceae bacterium]
MNKIITLVDQGVVSGVNFLMGILLTKLLGLDQYGVFAFLWMLVFFVSSIHQAFIVSPMYTLNAKQKNQIKYVSQLFSLQILFSVVTFFCVWLVASILLSYYPEYNFTYASIAIALTAAVYVLHDFMRRLFFSFKAKTKALTVDIIGYGLQPFIIFAFYWFQELTLLTVLVSIISSLTTGIIVSFLISPFPKLTFQMGETVQAHWRFSVYLIGTSILQWLSGNLFIAMAAGLLGPIAVGVIRMSQNIVGVLHVLFLALENSIPLKAAELLQAEGKVKMLQFIGKTIKQSVWPVIALLVAVILLSKTIISQLYGAEYIEYQYVLYTFCLLYAFVFVGTFLRFVIRTLEHNKTIFISYVATSIFSLFLAKIMVQELNIVGVLLGLIISQLITNAIYLVALKSEIKWIFR